MRGYTAALVIYKFGLPIVNDQDCDEFGATFQASGVVWRMWANDLTRSLNRSTWDTVVLQPPPEYIAKLLRHRRLEVRKSIIEGFLRDIVPPSRRDVIDPLLSIESVEDTEHA
ncbi:uncharacterized protein PITG_00832 [Phytophthora infestans T30-4]|uniref:Uncharacterized protein n=1 Tax=Phytophthora infestans (strain T30-4) TaxID=403677 RepID=D0MRS9_PHYIT|nr:uncharacterized protein PITG_00832 [Phytophthora infestans T30-4]EEY58198.1 conserved hypothetical protein [Phytophthora infestans T30-4]|eukprot:XP_002909384.1 conserved hypothetical protein [Phytophthora infestans T30-4]